MLRIPMTEYHEHLPDRPLSRFVERMWIVCTESPPYRRERIFPDGSIELFFNLGGPHVLIGSRGGGSRSFQKAWIAGERRQPLVVEMNDDFHMVGVRFRPGGASAFLDLPVSELTDQVVELDDVWKSPVDLVRERLFEARSAPSRVFRLLEELLLGHAGNGLARRPLVDEAVRRVSRVDETFSSRDLAGDLGISQKHLTRVFDRHVGLTPKVLQRVLRFQWALGRAATSAEVHWTTIAHDCGYYDQSHFIHDFRSFAHMTPSAYLEVVGDYRNEVPVP